MKKKIFMIFTVLWMIVIFVFSAQEASVSSATSSYILQMIIDKISLNLQIYDPIWDVLIFLLRKSAHIFEYFVLTILFYGTFEDQKHRIFITILATFFYACTDEIHQLFVEGRSGAIIDVGVDMIGCIIAMIIIVMIRYWYKKKEG